MKRKCLAIGIILLFVVIACSPIINAQSNTLLNKPFSIPEKTKTVSLLVQEFKADGTVEKSYVKLSKEQAEALHNELNNVKDLESRLTVYKKYNLIPQNVTAEKLRRGMEEKAQRLGLTNEKIQDIITHYSNNSFGWFGHFCLNFKSVVDEDVDFCLRLIWGTSLFTSFINGLIWFLDLDIPLQQSRDFFQFHIALNGILSTSNGILRDSYASGLLFASLIIGFVGYYVGIAIPAIFSNFMCIINGYAVVSIGMGILYYFEPYS